MTKRTPEQEEAANSLEGFKVVELKIRVWSGDLKLLLRDFDTLEIAVESAVETLAHSIRVQAERDHRDYIDN